MLTEVLLGDLIHVGQLLIGVSELFGLSKQSSGHFVQTVVFQKGLFEITQFLYMLEEPGIDAGMLMNLLDAHARLEGVTDVVDSALRRYGKLAVELDLLDGPFYLFVSASGLASQAGQPFIVVVESQAESLDLHGANALLEGLFEGTANAHGLTDALHLSGEGFVGIGEFFKSPTRNLDNAVIDSRFKTSGRLASNVVGDFVKSVADGELGGNLGNWESGGLTGQGRTSRYARVHLDDHHSSVLGIDAKLDVRAACLYTDFSDDGQGGVAHELILFVGEGLSGGDGDRIAGVHTHGVEVLN